MPFVRRCSALAAVCVAGMTMVACNGPTVEQTPNTVIGPPELSSPDTLLPVVAETIPPDDGTAPPGALFAGNFCTALTAEDFRAVSIDGRRATLAEDPVMAADGCDYRVEVGNDVLSIQVTARSQSDFAGPADPADSTLVIDEISGIGEAARGVARGDGYEIYVKVANGWFSVFAPNRASAAALAERAVPRAAGA